MEPVFTLPYSEYAVANRISHFLKHSEGYSLYVPLSRQEKGIDLLITKRTKGVSRAITVQVKSSRTYTPPPAKRETTERYNYYTWFNNFQVRPETDFFALIGLYPPEESRTRKSSASWWSSIILIFSNEEMRNFISNIKTVSGKQDKMFGFGFNDSKKIILTRGDQYRKNKDYSNYLIEKKIQDIKRKLSVEK